MLASLIFIGIINIITANPIRTFANGPSLGIIGGDPAKIEDHPYDAIVEFVDIDLFCAGAIVSDHHIVTIAQCASFTLQKGATVRAGTSSRGSGGSKHTIDKVTIHDDWDGEMGNNIAVVKVVEPFQLDKIPKAISPLDQDKKLANGTYGVVSGWGDTETDEGNQLHKLSVATIDDDACKEIWPGEYVEGGSLCAKNFENKGKGTANGDFGDPLVIGDGQDKRLAGILGWVYPRTDEPSGYINVAKYHDWIVGVINH